MACSIFWSFSPTPIHSSTKRLFSQILLDCNGSILNSVTESYSFSKITLISSGAKDCFRINTAFLISSSVDPHLGQVSPLDIKRFHLIFRVAEFLSIRSEREHSQLFLPYPCLYSHKRGHYFNNDVPLFLESINFIISE